MSQCMKTLRRRFRKAVVYGALASFLATTSQPALAGLTSLASSPLASTTSAQVKPNIMYLMDTSGSMEWSHMPDNMENNTTRVGYKSSQCNTIYYNPNIAYTLPKKADASNYPNAAFGGAYFDGYLNTATTTNLSTSFIAYDNNTSSGHGSDTAQAAYYYVYKDTGTPATTPALVWNSARCTQSPSGTPTTAFAATGGGTWQKILVSTTSGPGSTDERQNFADWYSYYRTRILMMKSAASRSFIALTSSYRVGLITINPNIDQSGDPQSSLQSSRYLAIDDFNTAQKSAWYTKLLSQKTSASTPLREALTRVGRHYAGKTDGINAGMTPDPVQYSCQQNFTLLTTDGFWNGGGGLKLNGTTAMDNQDGNLSITPRPMWDAGITGTRTTTTATNAWQSAACSVIQKRTTQRQKRTTQIQSRNTAQAQSRTQQVQSRTQQRQSRSGQLLRRTSSNYGSNWSAWAVWNSTSCTTDSSGKDRAECSTAYTPWANASTCSPSGPNSFGVSTECQTTNTGFVNASTCTANSGPVNGLTITCQTTDTGFLNAGSCTPSGPTNGQTVTCQSFDTGWANASSCTAVGTLTCQTTDTGWVNASSCTPSGPTNGLTITCQTPVVADWANVSSCTASSSGGLNVECITQTNQGQKIQYKTTKTPTTTNISGGVAVGTPTQGTPQVGNFTDLDGACYYPANTLPALPANGPVLASQLPAPPSGCSAWPCTTTTGAASGGSSNSLADVAQYYYNTDLRPTMLDNVPSTGQGPEDDRAVWQHMTTFTMGLGVPGTLTYRTDYKTATSGDFAAIRAGTMGWPVPAENLPTAIDDLWHAAVNGRGQYFSAGDPDTVVAGLSTALAGINARVASAAAAATSNLEPVAGDNFAYTAKYQTVKWTGELEAHQIDLITGVVLPTAIWSAQTLLDAKTQAACDTRKIYLYHAGAANNRVNFTWNTDTCLSSGAPSGVLDTGLDATEQGYFNATRVALLGHYPLMTDGTGTPATANQRSAAAGVNLVNYVRGQKGKEGFVPDDLNMLYRARDHVLGDIVSAQPVYVKAPFASYEEVTNPGYPAYKTGPAGSRTQMVYVAANDGMLHAFDAVTGQENWAFIPSIVLPNLYKLADNNWGSSDVHQYSVDGTPSVGDAFNSVTGWKTILVAGLNAGGKGYYAIDVTDPATPKALWEFKWSSTCHAATTTTAMAAGATSDCHLGYTFNNPLITKLANQRWVVIVTSGYNNVSGNAGDGLGYLYVLDAFTGEIIYKIATSAGDSSTPSGLNHTNNWVDNTLSDNKTLRVYGVDLLGNVWRFDVNDSILPAGFEAMLIGTAKDSSGNPQPISTRPELAEVSGSPMVFAATGRLLGSGDITDTQPQSIYGIRDPMTATTGYADLRAALKPMTMTQVGTGSSATRTIACTGTNAQCNSANGWVADLPDSGERVNVDMKLQLGTIVVASNVPQSTACTVGGYSWLNYLNFSTGTAVANSPGEAVSQMLSDSLAVGLNIVRLPSGKTVVITTTSDAKQTTIGAPFAVPSPTGRRISWREISQ